MRLPDRAAHTAEQQLAAALPRRWRHVQAVAAKAGALGSLAGNDEDLLVAAAWLHDIGYAPGIVETGFHALDGARWLLREGYPPRLAGLVAHHSCAEYEAVERGLNDVLMAEFPREESATSDALWYADMTTGPDGQNLSVEDRLAEIRQRYGPDDLVTRFWAKAERPLLTAIRRTEARMQDQPI
ncbi:HD domain-containing protein [Micromonospora echinaurantiaca]|uniref:HD domain-containing protein n=1 Tax=Micromonospora echinaurantiaca TaxID=47857 RepID=A0A1C5KCS3_9ACTN|nr:HD domain-containing protein [Micromonospora echinaurantiaca]SCG80645.1 HD domain-containing protein [Micromonospora echinaurantiaca]